MADTVFTLDEVVDKIARLKHENLRLKEQLVVFKPNCWLRLKSGLLLRHRFELIIEHPSGIPHWQEWREFRMATHPKMSISFSEQVPPEAFITDVAFRCEGEMREGMYIYEEQ